MQLRNWNMVIAAAIAGIAGTIVFDLLGLVFAGEWDVPNMIGEMLGIGVAGGAFMHYAIGITLAVIFAGLVPLFAGPMWLRGATFATLQTILGVWLFMMPMMEMGIAGTDSPQGFMAGFVSLVRHWGFGIVMGLVYAATAPRFAGPAPRVSAHAGRTEASAERPHQTASRDGGTRRTAARQDTAEAEQRSR